MPRDVVALVSADDFVSAVRVYADRVNDLLRRNGVPALEAIELCETHALALLDAVVNAPETVVDLAGWWFARAIEVTSLSPARTAVGANEPTSVLAGTSGEEQVRAALGVLGDGERAAVVLRDGYDLPPAAVGVALRRDPDSTAALTAAGRLHLVAAYDGVAAPDLAGHSGRTAVDVVALSRLADGSLERARAAPLRRHAANCGACENVLESLAKGRRLAAGLPIVAMDDDAREALIERVGSRAATALPSHDAVLHAVDEDHDPGPAVPALFALAVLGVALALGVGVALLNHAVGSDTPTPVPLETAVASPTPSFPVAIPTLHRHSRRATPTSGPSTTAPSSATPTETATTPSGPTRSARPPLGPPHIALSPTRGRSGTTITVSGSGFRPGTLVRLSYAGGRSTSTASADSAGDFVGRLQADALLPGQQTVTATSGRRHASAQFTQTL